SKAYSHATCPSRAAPRRASGSGLALGIGSHRAADRRLRLARSAGRMAPWREPRAVDEHRQSAGSGTRRVLGRPRLRPWRHDRAHGVWENHVAAEALTQAMFIKNPGAASDLTFMRIVAASLLASVVSLTLATGAVAQEQDFTTFDLATLMSMDVTVTSATRREQASA